MDSYLIARKTLINEERSLRFDYSPDGHTTLETEAIKAVRDIEKRDHEIFYDASDEIDVGMPFSLGKPTVEKTALFKLIKQMPKGALLHGHADAMGTARDLLQVALSHSNLRISSNVPLTRENISNKQDPPTISFDYLTNPETTQFSNVPASCTSYAPYTWASAHSTRLDFPGGPDKFDDYITSRISLPLENHCHGHISVAKIWLLFSSAFILNSSLLEYEPVFIEYYTNALEKAVEDKISWLELRMNMTTWKMRSHDGSKTFDHNRQIQAFQTCVDKIKSKYPSQFIGARLIYTVLRFVPGTDAPPHILNELFPSPLKEYMLDCIKMKQSFPQTISGFDLVGHEDEGITLKSYLPDLLWFKSYQKELGLEIPYFLHAGETLGDGDEIDDNLYDAILLGAKRIGHGFSIAKHPKLMQICRERGILLEVCPISNEILKYTMSPATHPLPIFLNNGVPVALSSDDPQMFGNHGLSYDYNEALHCSKALNIVSLGKLARQSLEYAEMPSKEPKEFALSLFDKQWLQFLHDIITSNGPSSDALN